MKFGFTKIDVIQAVAAKMLKKGVLIYLEGKVHTRSFTDKAGVKSTLRTSLQVSFPCSGDVLILTTAFR